MNRHQREFCSHKVAVRIPIFRRRAVDPFGTPPVDSGIREVRGYCPGCFEGCSGGNYSVVPLKPAP